MLYSTRPVLAMCSESLANAGLSYHEPSATVCSSSAPKQVFSDPSKRNNASILHRVFHTAMLIYAGDEGSVSPLHFVLYLG